MMFLYFIFGIFIGSIAVYAYMKTREKKRSTDASHETEQGREFIAKQAHEKEENLRNVLAILDEKEEIANDDVETALGVSDATASRYLTELEERGEIISNYDTGKYVRYTRPERLSKNSTTMVN